MKNVHWIWLAIAMLVAATLACSGGEQTPAPQVATPEAATPEVQPTPEA